MEERWGDKYLLFTYDEQGRPYSINYSGGQYYYVLNQQGDVIRIVAGDGTIRAEYRYNAWGEVEETENSAWLGKINPLRYRGYYYDSETGFYYVSSRYYDCENRRFLNSDTTDVLTLSPTSLTDKNLYAYCNNNPINNIDPLGLWTISISGTLSAMFGLGISLSFGFAFDDQGNFDLQYSYAVPGVDNTVMAGGIGAGAGIAVQYTKADTVYDLYGPATYVGASAGPGWFVGGDIVSFSDASDSEMTTDGFQFVTGVGIGVDVHVTESYTRSLFQTNKSSTQSSFSGSSQNRIMYELMLC